MADESGVMRGINWREAFPFTNIFRAFRIAIHPSKLVLALVALLLLYFGGRALDGLWPNNHSVSAMQRLNLSRGETAPPARDMESEAATLPPAPAERRAGIFDTFLNYEITQLNLITGSVLALRFDAIVAGIGNFVVVGPVWMLRNHPLFGIIWLAWFVVVWAVFGGAIARIAAVHVARDEKISVRSALRFSVSKILSFIFAPLIPLTIIALAAFVVALGGLLLYIPGIGPILVGLLLFLALAAGFVMTLVLLGMAGGFNLMYPTIAVEGSDSFDAISRSFSYIYARPWRLGFYTLVAVIYGALTFMFVRLFIFLVLLLSNWSVSWFLGGQPARYWNYDGPSTAIVDGRQVTAPPNSIWPMPNRMRLPYEVNRDGLKWSEKTASVLSMIWVYLTISLVGAFIISFYFSANTIIYYLMRREVDATEVDDVYLEEPEEDLAETAPVASTTTPATTTTITAAVVETTAPNTAAVPPAGDITSGLVTPPAPPVEPPPAEPPASPPPTT